MKKFVLLGFCVGLALTGSADAAKYGVFAGMNKYLSSYIPSSNWLNGCVPDANHVYTNTIQRGEWTAATVTRLLDSAGTKAAIRKAITNAAATAVAGDTFLYFHSSHGGNNDEPYGKSVYLCAYDDDYQDTELAADLAKFATGVKVVVMVDACHSGGLFQSSLKGTRVLAAAPAGSFNLAGRVTALMEADRTAKLARGAKGVEQTIAASEIGWITAANYDQYSWDGDTGGLFTDKVIEGWTNSGAASCDLNGDKYANFYELYKYASNVAYSADYEYTTAMAANTNVLLGTLAGWIGSSAPGGVVTFSNLTAQTVTVGQTLNYPVGAYTAGTTTPATVTMTTVQAGASYGSGRLTFTPTADGTYTFNFTATNALGGSASAALTVTAALGAPILSAASAIGNDRFTANWSAVPGAGSYRLDVATATSFSAGGTGATGPIVTNGNTGLSTGWEYVNGASNAGSYHKLVGTGGPGVVSPAFSTVGYTNAAAGFSVATFGGTSANALTISYSLNGGSSWTAIGTDTSATASSPYVSGSVALPAAALGQASVRVKWHCQVATAGVGLRLQNLNVSGAQPAGANTLVLNAQTVAGTNYAVTGLAMGTTYYYRVKAFGNALGLSSATGTVTTAASDSAPAFAAIPGQAATVGALFTLDVASYVSGYPAPALALQSTTAASGYGFTGGTLSFTPSATGTFAFVFRASNSLGVASATANVAVAAAPVTIPTASIANLSSNSFTVNWTAVTGGTTYQVQVATNNTFTRGASRAAVVIVETLDTGLATGWAYVNGASNSGSGSSAYHKLVSASGPGVVSPDFSTVGYTNATAGFSVATFGGASANVLTISYSADGGTNWTVIGTDSSATSSTYVAGRTMALPAGALGQSSVRIKWHCAVATASLGLRLRALAVSGEQGSGGGGPLVDQTVAALTYPVTGLTPATPYYVRVRATGGTWSDVVPATTTAGGMAGTPPTVNALGARHVVVGKTLSATVTATATDGDPILSYACASAVNASRWTFNVSSGAFTFTPASNDQGSVQFNFTATDKDGTSAPVALNVTVCVPQAVSGFSPPTNGSGVASASIATETGLTYALQYTTNLLAVPPVWVQVDSEAGTGGTLTLQDGTTPGEQRFYRVVIP